MADPFLLFAQHGWDDTNTAIASLARQLLSPRDRLVAPSLSRLQTWLRIEPLIRAVERLAQDEAARAPDLPWRIVGHSMGGLIWLEVLARHREWWSRVHSLTLIASPIGGADLARLIDPWGWGIGIARDLGRNRRPLAETIAAAIPTLVVAGDLGWGSDGTVPIPATQCDRTRWVCLPGLSHPELRYRTESLDPIRNFWGDPAIAPPAIDLASQFICQLRALPGITDTHYGGCARAPIVREFADGLALRMQVNLAGVTHIYLSDRTGRCLYAGFVGWSDRRRCRQALAAIAPTVLAPSAGSQSGRSRNARDRVNEDIS